MATVAEYVRLCPSCGAEQPQDVMRCTCGALLAGIDLKRKEAPEPEVQGPANDQAAHPAHDVTVAGAAPAGTTTSGPAPADPARPLVCPHPDCAQPNPPGTITCVYCNRPLAPEPALAPLTLLQLPAALAARHRLLRVLPTRGAEADLLLVQPRDNGPERVVKIYRQGIAIRREVRDRLARVAPGLQVAVLEEGTADGHAYEVMEYCAHGSLRELFGRRGALEEADLRATIAGLAAALGGVHAAGLVHRDLKPENVLVRAEDPLALVLTDFGIASVIDATQRFTSVARTLPYASPESLSGVIDAKSDWWALGMIVLEAALGKHPYAGLSDAVILHQLATRNIDTAAVPGRALRKLVRGLLQRDPATRWGEAEVARWLAGDATLPEPVETAAAAAFADPYRLGGEICTTPEQLAVALATHWREGSADIANGQLLQWFRKVQKDHNTVRLLIENRHEKKLHEDVQVLRLILHLAPGIPPVWCGESIALPAILAHASQALEGSAEAAQWLHGLYRHRVLEDYAQAGNAQVADVLARWTDAARRFDASWRETLALLKSKTAPRGGAVNWDQTVFGRTEPEPPSPGRLHARLLAIAYDANWAGRLRKRLAAELVPLRVQCPWLADLGDPATMDATNLLVVESLLPVARSAAERQLAAEVRRREEEAAACRAQREAFEEIVAAVQAAAQARFPSEELCIELIDEAGRYNELLARIRATGRSDEAWIELRNEVVRAEPALRRIQRTAEALRERVAVSAGWLNFRGVVVMLALLVAAPRFGRIGLFLVPAAAIGIILWRLVPNFWMLSRIRGLAARL